MTANASAAIFRGRRTRCIKRAPSLCLPAPFVIRPFSPLLLVVRVHVSCTTYNCFSLVHGSISPLRVFMPMTSERDRANQSRGARPFGCRYIVAAVSKLESDQKPKSNHVNSIDARLTYPPRKMHPFLLSLPVRVPHRTRS